jgi:hypothetical protein
MAGGVYVPGTNLDPDRMNLGLANERFRFRKLQLGLRST